MALLVYSMYDHSKIVAIQNCTFRHDPVPLTMSTRGHGHGENAVSRMHKSEDLWNYPLMPSLRKGQGICSTKRTKPHWPNAAHATSRHVFADHKLIA